MNTPKITKASTVGELRKMLESFPDDLKISYMDDDGNYLPDIDYIIVRSLGKFTRGGTPYYREYRLLDDEKWIADVEVLVLG